MKTKYSYLALAAVLAIAITGCGKKEDTNEQPVANSNAKKVIDTSTVGSVTGSVTLDGKPVPAKPINMSAEPYCQKAHPNPVVPPEVVVDDKGDLANVVVYAVSYTHLDVYKRQRINAPANSIGASAYC